MNVDARESALRQAVHWTLAAERLGHLDDLASPDAWAGLEAYLGLRLRKHLTGVAQRVHGQGRALRGRIEAVRSPQELAHVQRHLVAFRRQYLRAETTVEFFIDAVNSRTNPYTAGLLRACDRIAEQSMEGILGPIGVRRPPVLCYFDSGLGASILKAGLRLWDGGAVNPVAAIKVVRHNVFRSTALLHEATHMVAATVSLVPELRAVLTEVAGRHSPWLGEVWTSWASEIIADAGAFVHAGYPSVVGLHDVLAGASSFVFRFTPGDPHPISYIRVLLGCRMCRRYYGKGPWDALETSWRERYPLEAAEPEVADLCARSIGLLDEIVSAVLARPMKSLRGHALDQLVDPRQASPAGLERLERDVGPALYRSSRWLGRVAPRLLALSAGRLAEHPRRMRELIEHQEQWMLRLGRTPRSTPVG